MIPKIQGSTQMPAQIQEEHESSAAPKKSDKNGPMEGSNDQPRTAPAVQPRNPAAEQKYEAHRLATDLNAQLNSINGGKPKPPQTNGIELEELLVSHFKDKTPVNETNQPEGNGVKALQLMVDGVKSDPPKASQGSENKFGVWVEDTKL